MNTQKSLLPDVVIWLVLMALAATTAFVLLRRDMQRHFGAVSFGSFPEFRLPTVDKGYLDHHLLKGHVWAVHAGSSPIALMSMAARLCTIEQLTASGKRHLYVLTLSDAASPVLKPRIPFHYIAISGAQKRSSMFSSFGKVNEDTVFLVDQNGVVRGRYDINDFQEFRNFQQDLLHLL